MKSDFPNAGLEVEPQPRTSNRSSRFVDCHTPTFVLEETELMIWTMRNVENLSGNCRKTWWNLEFSVQHTRNASDRTLETLLERINRLISLRNYDY